MPAEPAAAHTHGIDAFGLVLEGEISRLDFARALGGLAGARGSDLLRVKGIVRFSDRPERPAVVQAAQHAMFAPEWLDDWPDDDRRSRLVFVVHEIPRAEILDASPSPTPARSLPRERRRGRLGCHYSSRNSVEASQLGRRARRTAWCNAQLG